MGNGNGNGNGSERGSGRGSGSFGQAVASLLDTYTKCLALLNGGRQRGSPVQCEPQANLGRSLRSDRARIRHVYSSRLSQDGSRLDKGDAIARSSLRRVIKRLTTAMADVVRMLSRRQPQSFNYDTFQSLSAMSSLDAIHAINDLSSRIGSQASSRQSKAESTISGRTRARAGARRHAQRSGGDTDKVKGRGSASRSAPRRHSTKSTGMRSPEVHPQAHSRQHRVSMATMSSDSTKLGEIRRRVSKLRIGDDAPRVAYPLHLDRPKVKREKKWWNLFDKR